MARRSRRVLVLGLDGGTFDLLDPLFAAGELPFLASVARGGLRAPLRSVYPAKTIPAWYSFATGLDPGELGIFGFLEPDGQPGRSRLVRTFRPAEAVWDTLSRSGAKVGVLNLPLGAGYPVHGFVLPGFFSDASKPYPPALRSEIEAALRCSYPGELPVYRSGDRARWVRQATRAVELRAQAASWLSERERPEFLFVLFRETDRLEHQLWHELSRPVEELPADLLGFWRAVDAGCERVARAFHDAPGESATIVVSDHGHGAVRSDFLTNRWLEQEGFLVFAHGDHLGGRRLISRAFLASQRFRLGQAIGGPVADFLRRPRLGRMQRLLSGSTSFEQAVPRIDWRRTQAFSYPIPEGIYLNPANPEVGNGHAQSLVQELRRRLEAYPDARIEVMAPSSIYRGQRLERAPALLLRIDGMATEPWMDFRYDRPLVRERPAFFYGSGTHRMDGVLLSDRAELLPGDPGRTPSLNELAPAILGWIGSAPAASTTAPGARPSDPLAA